MVFIPIQTHLSRAQGKKLMQGGSIALKKSQIGTGNHELHLTRQQVQQMYKAMKGGKIRFSNAQIKYNLKHGKGIWDWIKKGASWVYKQFKPHLKKGIRTTASALGSLAGTAAKEAVSKIPIVGTDLAQSAEKSIKNLANSGGEKLNNLIGDGMRMRGRGPYTPGRGLTTPGRGLYFPGKGLYTLGRGLKMVPSIQLPPPIKAVNSMATGY